MVVSLKVTGDPNLLIIGRAVIAVKGAERYRNGFLKKVEGSAFNSMTFWIFFKVFLKMKFVRSIVP